MCCSSEAHAIHAKTGTLARAIALSGYAESPARGWLAFSILVTGTSDHSGARQRMDDLVECHAVLDQPVGIDAHLILALAAAP